MSITWILCLVILLSIPVLLIWLGYKRQNLCSQVGEKFGYDSALALSSAQAWAYAQRSCVKRYMIAGCITAVCTFLLMLLALGVHAVGTMAYAVTLLLFELLVWCCLLISVESGLRKLLGVKEADL